MAERVSRQRGRDRGEQAESAPEEQRASADAGDKLKADLDDLLDAIDDVLESNAEEFVKSYVQKGGE